MKNNIEQKTYLTLATKIIIGFLLCFFIWAAFAPINSSVVANGEIILTSNKKTISHLEGGIVAEVKVSEGQFVEEGQDLIVLDTVQVKAKISQVLEGIRGSEFQKSATEKRISALKNELHTVNELLKNSNTSLTRKFDLQKQLHEAEGKLGELISNIASLQSEHKAALDTLERSVIKAPTSGVIMDLKHQTIGGVIAPASEIMFIVPKDDHLIAEVMVNPADIDLLTKGMTAKVQLTAYKARLMPKLDGKLETISGDSFKNEMNGQVYFKARIEIPDAELKKLKEDVKLTPGMPVTAFIITGSRTMLQYLLTPIKESAYKAFREE
ncbi:MAG: HlyD family efflux transporter periplasmic adaptor subunit [Proteobacteria bacterium]|nr:HlyD family efflux transporter periplasmic adaptor subunit [Pseudomonadota bacterium]